MDLPGLYIHIPFCRSKCPYCGFYSVSDLGGIPSYLAALEIEMDRYRERFPAFDTVYLGGGTPSVLAAGDLAAILGRVKERFRISRAAEVTVEVNPGDATPSLLRTLRETGVNRLNLGVQSFDDATLSFLGRRHSAGQAVEAIRAAREAGFRNIGIDLIYGLPVCAGGMRSLGSSSVLSPAPGSGSPGECGVRRRQGLPCSSGIARGSVVGAPIPGKPAGTCIENMLPSPGEGSEDRMFARWLATLETTVSFGPEHLSCYELTVETGTPLAAAAENLSFPGEEVKLRYFFRTSEILEAAGYDHYEVSNFSRGAAFRSRHNGKYWDRTPYLGLGPAAHSFDGVRRWWNHRDTASYVRELREGKHPQAGKETLSREQAALEALALGLRTTAGIDTWAYDAAYGCDLITWRGDVVDRLVMEGYLRKRGMVLAPTRKGLACADAMTRMLS